MDSVRIENQGNETFKIHVPGQTDMIVTRKELQELSEAISHVDQGGSREVNLEPQNEVKENN